jgi:hypothetical protein
MECLGCLYAFMRSIYMFTVSCVIVMYAYTHGWWHTTPMIFYTHTHVSCLPLQCCYVYIIVALHSLLLPMRPLFSPSWHVSVIFILYSHTVQYYHHLYIIYIMQYIYAAIVVSQTTIYSPFVYYTHVISTIMLCISIMPDEWSNILCYTLHCMFTSTSYIAYFMGFSAIWYTTEWSLTMLHCNVKGLLPSFRVEYYVVDHVWLAGTDGFGYLAVVRIISCYISHFSHWSPTGVVRPKWSKLDPGLPITIYILI